MMMGRNISKKLNLALMGIFSPDLPEGPPLLPADPADCWVIVQADIGVAGEEGSDIFTFYVTTPQWLQKQSSIGWRWGQGLLILDEFEWSLIESALSKLVESVSGETWEECAEKINRYGHWEFFDYNKKSN